MEVVLENIINFIIDINEVDEENILYEPHYIILVISFYFQKGFIVEDIEHI